MPGAWGKSFFFRRLPELGGRIIYEIQTFA